VSFGGKEKDHRRHEEMMENVLLQRSNQKQYVSPKAECFKGEEVCCFLLSIETPPLRENESPIVRIL
jgi:hypothetical protein